MAAAIALIRASQPSDAAEIAVIYGHYVRTTRATFETEPPDVEEIQRRREEIVALGLPYLVAAYDDRVIGFAYAAPFRTRSAYRFTVEESIYVHPDYSGKGLGRLLLTELIAACRRAGRRQMIAVIGGSDNFASIQLHESLGFRQVGILRAVGHKFGFWVDTVLMQRQIDPL